ncbi:MAG: CPBP family intramembrane metalloprotease [Verrucomicrobiae bacterium]|nr:CPBP family intramembrane metalloprotease [Verrucomicrobiae bacterium]
MKPIRAIVWYAVAVFGLSAIIAPWVFWVAQLVGDWPFRRVFNRVILAVAVLGLWPLLRVTGVRSWKEIGFVTERVLLLQLLWGFAIGVVSYALGLLWRFESLRPAERPGRLLVFFLIGWVVALIEETYFRGGLQNIMQRLMRPWLAVALVAAVYSVAHFLKPAEAHIPAELVRWYSGFEYLGRVLACSLQERGVWWTAISLWLVGVVLGWAFFRTGALYLSIGLHAGWVFALKTLAWAGAGSWVDMPVVWCALLLLLGAIECWARQKSGQRQH